MRAIFGVIVIFAAALVLAFAQDSQTAGGEAVVDGSVINRVSGAPVKRAHVRFAKLVQGGAEDAFESYVDTDAGGRFSTQVAAGRYRVWVERAGYSRLNYGASSALGEGKVLTLAPGQELHEVSFRLPPLGAISGHVLDEDGDPIQGAGVQVLKLSYATGRRALLPVSGTSSNDRGEYRAFDLPEGHYFLYVTRPGAPLSTAPQTGLLISDMQDFFAPVYYPGVLDFPSATQIPLPEGGDVQDADVTFPRVRVVTVRGRLVSPVDNFAETQFQVVLAPRDGNAASSIGRRPATTDKGSGRFEIHGVAPGSYMLLASQLYRGHVLSGRIPLEVGNSAHMEEIAVTVAPGSEITGAAEFEGGAADTLRGARVALISKDGLPLGEAPSGQIDGSGAFRLTGVAPGIWTVSVSPLPKGAWVKEVLFDGHEIPGGLLDLTASTRGTLHVTLAGNGARVAGTVTRDNQPRRATVVLAPVTQELRAIPSMYAFAMSDEQGNFAIEGVRPGSYKMFAFEDAAPSGWLDPEFLASVDSLGQDVSLSEGTDLKKDLSSIAIDSGQPTP